MRLTKRTPGVLQHSKRMAQTQRTDGPAARSFLGAVAAFCTVQNIRDVFLVRAQLGHRSSPCQVLSANETYNKPQTQPRALGELRRSRRSRFPTEVVPVAQHVTEALPTGPAAAQTSSEPVAARAVQTHLLEAAPGGATHPIPGCTEQFGGGRAPERSDPRRNQVPDG